MKITQRDAREKWCPFVRAANLLSAKEAARDGDVSPAVTHNRLVVCLEDDRSAECASDYSYLRCIGSQCMAWEWVSEPLQRFVIAETAGPDDPEPKRPVGVGDDWEWHPIPQDFGSPAVWLEPEHEARERSIGYCGRCR